MASGDVKFITFPINYNIGDPTDPALTIIIPAATVAGHTFVALDHLEFNAGNNGAIKTRAVAIYTED